MTEEATKTEVGSYFISNYPPFSQWTPGQLDEVRQALNQPPADVPLGLYLHIPFCSAKCTCREDPAILPSSWMRSRSSLNSRARACADATA